MQRIAFEIKEMNKEKLRSIFRQRLAEISPAERAQKSKSACSNLISTKQFQNAKVIMFYLPMPQEIDTTDAILYAWKKDKTVVVPKVFWKQKRMTAVRISSFEEDFSIDVGGLRNPKNNDEVAPQTIDLIVVPALVFDRKGFRLGRGGGYYDKFLANPKLLAKKSGFCFAEQLLEGDNLPVMPNDIPVDLLVTDKEIILFN
jgi:5-formyltetrahydrofolate cyclo-ligase